MSRVRYLKFLVCLSLISSFARASVPPGGTTTPTQWVKADAGLYQSGTRAAPGAPCATAGDPVGLWLDQSGANVDAAQAASGNRPTCVPYWQNGLPGVKFVASGSQYLSPLAPSVPRTVIAVVSNYPSFNHDTVCGATLNASNTLAWAMRANEKPFGYARVGTDDVYWGGAQKVLGGGSVPGQVSVYTFRVRSSDDLMQVYVNGTQIATATYPGSGLPTTVSATQCAIGADFGSGAFTDFLTGTVGEIIEYNTDLSDAELASVTTDLIGKWGIQSTSGVFRFYRSCFGQMPVAAGNATAEQLYICGSNDLRQWYTIPNNFLPTTVTVRDPSVLYDATLAKYICVFTCPLQSNAANNAFGITVSTDLVNWASAAFIDESLVAGGTAGAPAAGSAVWAPELFIDVDGSLHVFFAATTTNNTTPAFAIYETHATDATLANWSVPAAVGITGLSGSNTYDPFVLLYNSKYYLFVANGGYVQVVSSSSLTTGYTPLRTGNWLDYGTSASGQPGAAATVSVTGGGTTGGSLAAGAYYAEFTYVLNGSETKASPQSAQFTVAAGDIPLLTFPSSTLPAGVTSCNLYLTAANGASGTETLYAGGVTSATVACAAFSQGSVGPPAGNAQMEGPSALLFNGALYLTCDNYNQLGGSGTGGTGLSQQLSGDWSNPASTPVFSPFINLSAPFLFRHGTTFTTATSGTNRSRRYNQ